MKILVSTRQLRNLRKGLHATGVAHLPGVTVRALNRAAQSTQTAILRESAAELGVTRKRLVRRVRFERRDEATTERYRSQVFIVTSDMPVSYLGKPRQNRRGVRVKGRQYDRAFISEFASGHTAVVRRYVLGQGTMTPKQYKAILAKKGYKKVGRQFRLPVKEIKETVRYVLRGIADGAIKNVGEPTFRKRFWHEMRREMSRALQTK
jgi:hypothetical protein